MSGEKMSKSLGNTLQVREIVKQWRPVEVRYYLGAAHYRSAIEFSPEALDEAAAAYRRIENFVEKASAVVESHVGQVPRRVRRARWTTTWASPTALGVLHDTVRAGNTALADGAKETVREALGAGRGDDPGARLRSGRVGRERDVRPDAGASMRWCRWRWRSEPRPASARTTPPRTRSATSSPRPGWSSRTPPTDRAGALK